MCIASVKSMTYALKAKRALASHYINSEIIKLDSSLKPFFLKLPTRAV